MIARIKVYTSAKIRSVLPKAAKATNGAENMMKTIHVCDFAEDR